VVVARRLRQETTMSLKWIADRLHMGSWTYVEGGGRAAGSGTSAGDICHGASIETPCAVGLPGQRATSVAAFAAGMRDRAAEKP
jgi:hypothetical protein